MDRFGASALDLGTALTSGGIAAVPRTLESVTAEFVAAQKQLEGMQDQKGRLLLMGVAKDLDKIDESIQAERAALKKKDERDADERPR